MFDNKRFNILCGFLCILFIVLTTRLIYLQIVFPDQLIHEGNMRSLRVQNVPVSRGAITDRVGRLLAINILAYAIWIDPAEIIKHGGISVNVYNWNKLSVILSIPLKKLILFVNDHAEERFLYLARQLDSSVIQHVSELELPGVYLLQESKRYYPAGCIAAHLVGITNIDNQGIEGIEKSFNVWLTGQAGTRVVRKNRCGRVVESIMLTDSKESQDVVLSIDERLQRVAYHALDNAVSMHKAESGSIVLIDINTGEILAMTNIPSYNPNNLSIVDPSIMRNRAITDAFEPGSTVKPIVIMTALKYAVVTQDTVLNTLPYVINGYQIKDVVLYKQLTVKEILQKSSNVGVSKLALSMPASYLAHAYKDFGMGKITNIGLIGESSGIYPHNSRHWSDIERAMFAYGYGFMITPLQLAKVYVTIGNMGKSKPLSIVKIDTPVIGNQVFPESLVRTVVDMMEGIALPGGIGHKAAVKGYRIAVKTGTVKKVGIQGKYVNKYIAYTAGIAPVSNPRFALVVIINDPKNGHYYGGRVSAPVFSVIMENTLKIMSVVPDSVSMVLKK